MKKIITTLVLVFALTITTQAQKNVDHKKLSNEQRTELTVKKMALRLDLTQSQQQQIKPLIAEQIADRKVIVEKRKAMKDSGKKLTADERYAMQSAKLDKQIAFKNKMKSILNKEQFEKFEKKYGKRVRKMKQKFKKRKAKLTQEEKL